ncbi:MAG TPA: hypothetical protein VFC67_20815 [Prolixibacteraceae bacterium]|nr:hypothetical protein [Prolixibacteraceae bacterium]
MMDVSPFVLTLMKWSLITIVLVVGLFILNRTRTFSKGRNGKKLSFNKRKVPYAAEIILDKSKKFNPSIIAMTVTNTGTKDIDLNSPVITFKRWFSNRKFRVLKVEHAEIYPLLLEPGKAYVLDISLDQFYQAVPELQLACRMSIEMKDRNGKSFKSQTIRLKLI